MDPQDAQSNPFRSTSTLAIDSDPELRGDDDGEHLQGEGERKNSWRWFHTVNRVCSGVKKVRHRSQLAPSITLAPSLCIFKNPDPETDFWPADSRPPLRRHPAAVFPPARARLGRPSSGSSPREIRDARSRRAAIPRRSDARLSGPGDAGWLDVVCLSIVFSAQTGCRTRSCSHRVDDECIDIAVASEGGEIKRNYKGGRKTGRTLSIWMGFIVSTRRGLSGQGSAQTD